MLKSPQHRLRGDQIHTCWHQAVYSRDVLMKAIREFRKFTDQPLAL
jgi:hypothetical protein